MRYLNKIVFINAAAIPYAEILLDGNVHFIGTQGVGKSTLLRAILFFYNADAQHLGISREKKTFSEHYFPNANSYIVYEVMRETGPYCVMAWKSQNRVCFRFFEGPYLRDIFIQDGFAFEGWEKCKNQMDKFRIRHTPKIDNYGEYRDILYGNQDGKRIEYRKYALLESRQYQNIPRTIQNVFLNSKLNAEFIKQTIIQSLNEDDVEIDLTTYTLHLKSFESDLSDIEKFKNPEVRKFAERSARFHLSVLTLTKEYHQFGNQLVYTVEKIKSGLPELQEKYDKEFLKREKVASKLADLDQKQREKELKLMSDIKVIDSQIKRTAEKREMYNSLGIEELLKRQDRKPGLIRERQQQTDEKSVLTAAYTNITKQFDDRLKLIEQAYQTELLAKNTELQVGKENHLNNENAERKLLDAKEIEIKENSKENISMAEVRLDQTRNEVQKGQLAL